jgi:hypothetical protein
MNRHGVLRGGIDEFLFRVGGYRNGAVPIARVLAAINKHPRHHRLLLA